MSNKFVKVSVKFDKLDVDYDLEEEITGYIYVEVQKEVSFRYLKVNLFLELRGKANPVAVSERTISLEKKGVWSVGEVYEYRFKFAGGHLPSFRGYNLHGQWYIETDYLLTEDSQKDTGTFKFYKKIFYGEQSESSTKLFTVRNKSKSLEVLTDHASLSDKNYHWTWLSMTLLISFVLHSRGVIEGWWYLVPVILFCASLFSYGLYFRDYYYFRELDIRFLREKDKHMQTEILLNGRLNSLENVRIGYKIVEKVLDDRGTSTTTLTHTCHTYLHPEPLVDRHGVIAIDLPFPEFQEYPPTFAHEQHEINWFIFLQTPGIFAKFTKDIPIKVAYKNI